MASKANLRRVLSKTRTLFQTTHWTQGSFLSMTSVDGEEKDTFCAVGGLRYVVTGYADGEHVFFVGVEEYRESLALLATAIDPEEADEFVEDLRGMDVEYRDSAVEELENIVISWNDETDRDLDDVLAVFTRAMEPVAR